MAAIVGSIPTGPLAYPSGTVSSCPQDPGRPSQNSPGEYQLDLPLEIGLPLLYLRYQRFEFCVGGRPIAKLSFLYVHTLTEGRVELLLSLLRTCVFWCGEAEPLRITSSPQKS